jgi:hypothetical protein
MRRVSTATSVWVPSPWRRVTPENPTPGVTYSVLLRGLPTTSRGFPPGLDDVITNPTILVEVLSSSTEEHDRGIKWIGYQRIGSLTDYLLVAQAEARIEHYRRNPDGGWSYRTAQRHERVVLTGGGELAVNAIFAGMFDLPGE